MTKRWERELRNLNDVEVPTDRIRERSRRESPIGDPGLMPSPRQRVVAGVVAFSVFIAAGAFAWRILRTTDSRVGGTRPADGTIVATFKIVEGEQGGSGPSATLTTQDETIHGTPTSYSWATRNSIGFVDTFTLEFAAKDFVEVAVGSLLLVDSDATGVGGGLEAQGTYPFKAVQAFGQIGDPVPLDQPPGRYVLHLIPAWDEGTVNYYFPIELVAPEPTPVPDGSALLSFVGGDPPEASLTWDGTQQDAVRGEYTWCEGSAGCVAGTPEFATYPPVDHFLPIPAGTALRLEGDVTQLTGSFLTLGGEKVSDVAFDDLGTVPTSAPGRYALELHVDLMASDYERGSATFFFGIQAPSGPVALDCDLAHGGTSIGGSAVEYVSDEAAIRSLIGGLRPQDLIEALREPSLRAYRIVRGGSVIAWARVGPGPDGATRVEWEACADSGLTSVLGGTSWRLVSINGIPVPETPKRVTLQFAAERLGGYDGCNDYGARYQVEGTTLRVGDIASTLILCNGGAMDRAHALKEGLRGTTSFEVSSEQLNITASTTTLTFEPDTSS